MASVDRVRAAVAPESGRGDVLGAGAVLLTALVYLLNDRFDGTWATGVHFVYSGLAAALVLGMAWMSVPTTPPRPYQSVLYVAGFALALATLANLADLLGANEPLAASGTIVWVGGLLTALAASFAFRRGSAASTLLAALTGGVVVLAFVDWVFSPESFSTFRYILVALALAYGVVGFRRREPLRRATQFVNAAGVAALAIAFSFALLAVFEFFADGGDDAGAVAWGWELFLLAVSAVLIAYAYATREAAPGYLGAANLLGFVLLAAIADDTLIGWPLVLGVLAAGALAAGLRPGARPPDAGVPAVPREPEPAGAAGIAVDPRDPGAV